MNRKIRISFFFFSEVKKLVQTKMVLILLKTGRSEAFAKDGQNSKLVLLCYNHHRWKNRHLWANQFEA